jgi:phosphoglycolate phosphatase
VTTRPRALLFDWDNTLVDSWGVIHEALTLTFEAMGREPWSLATTKERVRHSLRDAFPKLFGERWEEARQRYLDAFTAIHLERLRPVGGADALIAGASEAGYYLAVVSNKTGAILRLEADHLHWTPNFRRIVGAGDARADKPDPAPVHQALEGSGIAPDEAWLIGDTALDMECAIGAGAVPVLLGSADVDVAADHPAQPNFRVADCASLLMMLRGL